MGSDEGGSKPGRQDYRRFCDLVNESEEIKRPDLSILRAFGAYCRSLVALILVKVEDRAETRDI